MHVPMRGLSTPRFEDESVELIVNNYILYLCMYIFVTCFCVYHTRKIYQKKSEI